LEGTVAALREERIKKIEIIATERKARRIGFVNQGILSKIGGRTKSLALGGTNPFSSALKRDDPSTQTPIEFFSSSGNGATLWAKASVCEIQKM
jgi:hypothetical protein